MVALSLTNFLFALIRIIIVLSLQVVLEKCDTIGEPRIYDGAPASTEDKPGPMPDNSRPRTAGPTPTTNLPYSSNPPFQPPPRNVTTNNSISNNNSYLRPSSGPGPGSVQPLYMNHGPITRNEAPARVVPISSLNPYQGRWTIKARVTSKGELRRYNNPRGEGKVFSFDLLDSEGGEIRVTCFNAVADQFFDLVEQGKVYLVSRGSLKPVVQRNFNHLNSEYEIFLESSSTLQKCNDVDDASIPRVQLNFRPISEIEAVESNAVVDLAGIVSSVNPATTILRKNGTETMKQTLQLRDMSGRSVELTLWGAFCGNEGQQLLSLVDSGQFPVLAVKAARVNDFGGKSVGTISSSQLFINPEEFPLAQQLRQWHESEGKHSTVVSISKDPSGGGRTEMARKTVTQIKDEGLGRAEKPDWITIKATITFLKVDNFCYTACPLLVNDRPCNKKVNNNGDGTWRCDRCDRSFPECDYRYLLQLQVQDHTGLTWVTAFQETGEEIMGLTAKELNAVKYEEQDETRFAEIIREVLFREYILKLKVKEETFSDEQRVKSTVVKAERVNALSELRHILSLIDKTSDPIKPTNSMRPPVGPPQQVNMSSSYGMTPAPQQVNMSSSYGMTPAPQQVNMPSYGGGGSYNGGYSGGGSYNSGNSGGGGSYISRPANYAEGNVSMGGSGASYINRPVNYGQGGGGGGGGSYVNKPASYGQGEGGGGSAASGNCFKCQQPGHWARDCPGAGPGQGPSPQPYGSGGRYGYPRAPSQQLGGY